jgi:ATP synthase protein I
MNIAESNSNLWRGALTPSLLVSLLSIVVSTSLIGFPGLWGALLATTTVVIFFSVSMLVSRITKDANPITTMALAMLSYFSKLILMALFLILVTRLTEPGDVDRTAFGVSALLVAIAWLGGEIRAFFRLRLQLSLPENATDPNSSEPKR